MKSIFGAFLLIGALFVDTGSAISCYLCRPCKDKGILAQCTTVSNACVRHNTSGLIRRDCAVSPTAGCNTVKHGDGTQTETCACKDKDGCNSEGVSDPKFITNKSISCYFCNNCQNTGSLVKCSAASNACVKHDVNGVIKRDCGIAATAGCWTYPNQQGTIITSCNCWNKDGCNGAGKLKSSIVFVTPFAVILRTIILH